MKKVGNILLDILIVLVVLIALAMSVMVISSKASGVPNVLGYSPMTVQTDSMVPTFNVGDLLIDKKVNTDTLKVGDVITYKEVVNNVQILNTHRIVKIFTDAGLVSYVTKGDHEKDQDIMPVRQSDVVGKWTGHHIPLLGKIMDFIKSQMGIMVCFVIPLALLFIWQLYKFIMLLADNKKQKAVDAVTSNLEEEKQKAVEEYIARQKAEKEAEEKVKQVLTPPPSEGTPPPEPPEDTENPKEGQEPAPAAETNEPGEDAGQEPASAEEPTEDEMNPTTAPAVPLPLTREANREAEDGSEENEETPAGEPENTVGRVLAPAEDPEADPAEDIKEEIAEEPDDAVGQGLAPAADEEEAPAEEIEMNPTTAPAVPLPLTREVENGSSIPEEIEKAPAEKLLDSTAEDAANAEEDSFVPELPDAMDAEDEQTDEPEANETPAKPEQPAEK